MVDLDELEESDAKRTPGEWRVSDQIGCEGHIRPHDDMPALLVPGLYNDNQENDTAHTTKAVNALPAMIAELRGLREKTAAAEERVDRLKEEVEAVSRGAELTERRCTEARIEAHDKDKELRQLTVDFTALAQKTKALRVENENLQGTLEVLAVIDTNLDATTKRGA